MSDEIVVSDSDYREAERSFVTAPFTAGVVVKEKELLPAQPETRDSSVLAIISRAAMNPDIDMEKFSQLMEWQQKLDAQQQKAQFNAAMAAAQGEISSATIRKDRYNNQTKSYYSTMAAIAPVIVPIYSRHGLSLIFGEFQPEGMEGHLGISCIITHSGGHSEERKMILPYDLAGIAGSVNKTKIHAHGSTTEYGRRYLTRLIFNLVSSEDAESDDDGQRGGDTTAPVYLTEAQIKTIRDTIAKIGDATLETRILRTARVESLEQVPEKSFTGLVNKLKANAKAAGVDLGEV